jgi:glycosyltransferase involved in cell wall biosynthesis
MRKRLLYITAWGIDRTPHAETYLPALAADGWEITMVAPNAEQAVLRRVLGYPCQVRNLGDFSRLPVRTRVARIVCALIAARFGPYDVLYLQSHGLAPLAGLLLRGPLSGKRLVYHTTDYIDPLRYRWRSRLEGMLARRAGLYMNAEYHRAYISRTQHRITAPILVAPPNLPVEWPVPGPDPALRERLAGGPRDAFVIRLSGGFHPLRMVPNLLQAVARLPERFRLTMTKTPADETTVLRLLRRLGIAERVVLLDQRPYEQTFAYSVNADAGVLLYANNDLGNFFQAPGRLTECMSCGLPVVASNFTGLQNLITAYELGVAVDATAPASIAAGFLELETGIRDGRFSRDRIRRVFLDRFASNHWYPAVREAFNDLLTGKPMPAFVPTPSSFELQHG